MDEASVGFVLLSGGIDSTTCLALAKERHKDVFTYSVNYGQRHLKEMASAHMVSRHYHTTHSILPLGHQPHSMLTDINSEVPNTSYKEIKGISPTYVPFRNGQLISRLAAEAHAWSSHDAGGRTVVLYFGAHAEDAAGWAYPDCTPEFIGAMANAVFIGTYQRVRLEAPLTYLDKGEIIRLGVRLYVPYAMTWSCYKGGEWHCGTCPTCRARHDGFVKAEVSDPTRYLVEPWNSVEVSHTP